MSEDVKATPQVVHHSVITIAAMKHLAQFFVERNIAKHQPLHVVTNEEGVIEITGENKGNKSRFMVRFNPKDEQKQYSYFEAKGAQTSDEKG